MAFASEDAKLCEVFSNLKKKDKSCFPIFLYAMWKILRINEKGGALF